jgi:hypothetical protein
MQAWVVGCGYDEGFDEGSVAWPAEEPVYRTARNLLPLAILEQREVWQPLGAAAKELARWPHL